MRERREEVAVAEDRLLGVHEAASKLGMSPKTVYQWAYERRIPVVKLFGKALRFRLSVIEKLITESERPALSKIARTSHDND